MQHSFTIFDASAGSGKTYTMVREYLRIILTSRKIDAYRNILAITFTNKAVQELKSRIVDNLTEFTKETPNDKAQELLEDLSKTIEKPVSELKKRSKEIVKHLIHNYAAFDISTIDKFTHRIIRAFAFDLNLPTTFEVTLDTNHLLSEAVDAIISRAGEDPLLTKLLVDFTLEKTDDDKSWDVSRDIFEKGSLLLNENNRLEIETLSQKSVEDFIEIKANLIDRIQKLKSDVKRNVHLIYDFLSQNELELEAFKGQYFPKHLQRILNDKFDPTAKRYDQIDNYQTKKNSPDEELMYALAPQIQMMMKSVYGAFDKAKFFGAILKNINPLSLLTTLDNEFKQIQKEQNILSISEFNAIINREIQHQPAPFIYERLGEKYRHYFIDEFQDTSEMQWLNLIPLINNALAGQDDLGQKGTLMIVGDPKQSIYRWRGGKAEQFIELSKEENNPFSNPDKFSDRLKTNHRSYSEIINFNNHFFKQISEEFDIEDYKKLYRDSSHQEIKSKIGGFVNIHFIDMTKEIEVLDGEENEDDEANEPEIIEDATIDDHYCYQTYQTIKNILDKGFEQKDITILIRKKKHGNMLATYLSKLNIQILSSESLMLQNADDIKFIINVLRYLSDKTNKESKALFLYYIALQNTDYIDIHDFIAEGIAQEDEIDFQSWLANFDIEISFDNIRKKSLYEVAELIISKFVNYRQVAENQGDAYLQYFLDVVLERDIKKQVTITDFLEYWDLNVEKFSIPAPEGTNAVQIMTIHKSKGLEFPVVIFPFADENYDHSPKDEMWVDVDEKEFGLSKALIANSKAAETYGEIPAALYFRKKQEELLDNINLLYVALTRAEEQLYIISRMVLNKDDQPKDNTMSAFFIKFLQYKGTFSVMDYDYTFGNSNRLSVKKDQPKNDKKIERLHKLLDPRNIKIAQREALMWGTTRQDAIEYGNVVHEILAMVKSKADIENAINTALDNGLINQSQKETVRKAVHEVVGHPKLHNSFDPQNRVMTEQTIIQKEGKTVKPDRMVFSPQNEVYLIDYKTGNHNNSYEYQLRNYQYAIEKMGYKVKQKALVYIGETIEVVSYL